MQGGSRVTGFFKKKGKRQKRTAIEQGEVRKERRISKWIRKTKGGQILWVNLEGMEKENQSV